MHLDARHIVEIQYTVTLFISIIPFYMHYLCSKFQKASTPSGYAITLTLPEMVDFTTKAWTMVNQQL